VGVAGGWRLRPQREVPYELNGSVDEHHRGVGRGPAMERRREGRETRSAPPASGEELVTGRVHASYGPLLRGSGGSIPACPRYTPTACACAHPCCSDCIGDTLEVP